MSGSTTLESDKFSKNLSREYGSHKKKVLSVSWSNLGTQLASGSADSSIRIWNLTESGLDKGLELKGHSDGVSQIAWSPVNPHIIASASSDKNFKLWDVRSSKSNIKTEKTKGIDLITQLKR